jgi:c-di-AMP phosphodiesterase-like protein
MARGSLSYINKSIHEKKLTWMKAYVARVLIYFQNRHHITYNKKDQDQIYFLLTHQKCSCHWQNLGNEKYIFIHGENMHKKETKKSIIGAT